MANDVTDDPKASAEAAFAVEFASSAALQGLSTVAKKEVVRMAWLLGYCKGRSDAFLTARGLVDSIPTGYRSVSTGPGDLDVCGRPLKAGS